MHRLKSAYAVHVRDVCVANVMQGALRKPKSKAHIFLASLKNYKVRTSRSCLKQSCTK